MKYLRILILILLLVLVGIATYYLYLVLNTNKSIQTVDKETETPINVQNIVNPSTSPNVISKFIEYTSAGSALSGKETKIQGSLQAVDSTNKIINGISYSHVLGVLDNNGTLVNVLLTSEEYEVIRTNIPSQGIPGTPVVLTLSQNGVDFNVNLPK